MIKIENRNQLLSYVPKNIKFAELGVFNGEYSKIIKDIINPSELYLVDLFEGVTCSGDKDGNNITYLDLGESYKNLCNLYSEDVNIKVIKSNTEQFLSSLPDEYLDAVYIDADHSYEGVKKDLELSYRKVKKGGLIMGHDYSTSMFPGVVDAVNQFCYNNKLEINYLTNDGCPTFLITKI